MWLCVGNGCEEWGFGGLSACWTVWACAGWMGARGGGKGWEGTGRWKLGGCGVGLRREWVGDMVIDSFALLIECDVTYVTC